MLKLVASFECCIALLPSKFRVILKCVLLLGEMNIKILFSEKPHNRTS